MRGLESQLARLKELLAEGAMTGFFANPALTPEPRWFPDRWSPDVVAVRHLLFRLAEYAGMGDLDLEVTYFENVPTTPGIPGTVKEGLPERAVAGLYLGTHEGTAYFGIEPGMLDDPDRLLGVLAHEMCHAWRDRQGLPRADRGLEEELTDLTSVALGFGILTANSAYQYASQGSVRGGFAYTSWSHRQAGYLPVDIMSALVAVHSVTRGDDSRRVRRFLPATQAAAFDEALRWIATQDLDELLALPPAGHRPSCTIEHASTREFTHSRAEVAAHREIEAIVAATGEDGGWLPDPVAFGVHLDDLQSVQIAAWGRATGRGGWWRALHLVRDPEWTTQAVVLTGSDARARFALALGHLNDRACSSARRLKEALAPLFGRDSPRAGLLFPGVPGCVFVSSPARLGASELESLFRRLANVFDPGTLWSEALHLDEFASLVLRRLEYEAQEDSLQRDPPPLKDGIRSDWWSVATDPARASAEWTAIGLAPRAVGGGDPP